MQKLKKMNKLKRSKEDKANKKKAMCGMNLEEFPKKQKSEEFERSWNQNQYASKKNCPRNTLLVPCF